MFVGCDLRHFAFIQEAGPATVTERGFAVALGEAALAVDAVRDDVVRFQLGSDGDEPAAHPLPQFHVERERGGVRLVTRHLRVIVTFAPFGIRVERSDGSVVLASSADAKTGSLAFGTLNDEFMVVRSCGAGDGIFGLGEKTGPGNRRGRRFLLWNTDILAQNDPAVARLWPFERPQPSDPADPLFDPYYVSIPFFVQIDPAAGAAAGFFFDTAFPAYVDFSSDSRCTVHVAGGRYCEYVFAGPDMTSILGAYTAITGRPPVPPLWALGHHQCRWHLYNEAAVYALAERYRQARIPCDALWLDIDYMDGYRVFTWNTERFPQPAALLDRLRGEGFRLVTIIDPGVKEEPGYEVYDDGVAGGHFCRTEGGALYTGQVWPGRSVFPDFHRAETRAWWAERIASFVSAGVAGLWNDMNEPSTGEIPAGPMRFDGGRLPHAAGHNRYATLMAEATVAGLERARPGERPFILSRAGGPGIQRYAANWLGDNMARWEHLAMSLPMAAGLALSGQSFVGADVGGFAEPSDGELLVRWYQAAALMPFFRNHNCDTVDQYPWSFGPAWQGIIADAIRLRYRLMPYLYAAFVRAAETGEPVLRPMVYAAPADRRAWDVDDQIMVGDRLLVAPVIAEGQTRRSVYLPTGTWHDWHTGTIVHGAATVEAAAPPDILPLFVSAGAVIPMWPDPPLTTMGYQPETIELRVFVPDADGAYRSLLEEDDGLTTARAGGAFIRTELTLIRSGDTLALTGRVTGNGFPQFRRRQFRLSFRGAAVESVKAAGRPVAIRDGAFVFANVGEAFTAMVMLAPSTGPAAP